MNVSRISFIPVCSLTQHSILQWNIIFSGYFANSQFPVILFLYTHTHTHTCTHTSCLIPGMIDMTTEVQVTSTSRLVSRLCRLWHHSRFLFESGLMKRLFWQGLLVTVCFPLIVSITPQNMAVQWLTLLHFREVLVSISACRLFY
jgi:hypothetical protein